MKRGVPPTDLNARTGLSTPPGRIATACSKSFRDFVVRFIVVYKKVRDSAHDSGPTLGCRVNRTG